MRASGRTQITWLRIFLDARQKPGCFKGGAWGFAGSRPGLEVLNLPLKINDVVEGQGSGCRGGGALRVPMGHPYPFLFPTVPKPLGLGPEESLKSEHFFFFWVSSFSSHPRRGLPSYHPPHVCFVLFESRKIPGLLPVRLVLSASPLPTIFFF